jgi:putative flippase GtrA
MFDSTGPSSTSSGLRLAVGGILRRPIIRRILKFAAIGMVVNAVYAGLFFLLTLTGAIPRLWAAALSYTTACAFQYCANALLTFERQVFDGGQIGRYLLVVTFGCALSSAFLTYVSAPLGVPDIIGLPIVMLGVPFINFVLFSKFVYK